MTEIELLQEVHSQTSKSGLKAKLRVNALLVLVTLIWGSTFLIVQDSLKFTGPFSFLGIRFGIGALALAIIFHKRLLRITWAEARAGSAIGVFLFAAYALQTTGLQFTTTSMAGFITTLYVPLTALFAIIFLRQKLTMGSTLGVLLSLTGLSLISINNQMQFNFGIGEWLILGCAFASALHIISVSRFAPRADAINLAIVQIALTSLLSFIAIPVVHESFSIPTLPVWGSALFLGIFATAFCLVVMNRVQQFVSSTQATLIYALEPVWVAILGFAIGENLSVFAWVGCGLILMGSVIGEIPFKKFFKKNKRVAY